MPKIKCSVDNCYYWDSGNICGADAIEVSKNLFDDIDLEVGSLGADLETGGAANAFASDMEAGTMGNDPNASNQTQCLTFKPAKDKK